ncbi:MAG: c-type cytochrome [Flavisolibacter sp.]
MRLFLITIIILLTVSCKTKTNGWQTLDFGVFKMQTPHGWEIVKEQGIDSYYGGLTNGKDSLWFDFGMYGVDLSGEDTIAHKFAKDTINGLYSRVTIPKEDGKGYISVHIPKVSGGNQFTIWGKDIKETGTILKMYKSLVFPNSDTTQIPPLTENKYVLLSHGSGKTMFQQNCASCHAIHKVILGLPLNEVVTKRSTDWIYKFITDSISVANDTAHISIRRQYDYHCLQFPSLTKQDIELLVDYVKSR